MTSIHTRKPKRGERKREEDSDRSIHAVCDERELTALRDCTRVVVWRMKEKSQQNREFFAPKRVERTKRNGKRESR